MVRVGGTEDQKYHACTKNQREKEREITSKGLGED